MPTIITVDLRLNEPRYASLPNIMKAKAKPLATKTPADYGVDVSPRLLVVKTVEPAGRKAGVKVGSVAELIAKLKDEAGVALMAVLLLADVVGGALATDQVAKTLTAVKSLGPVTVLVAGPDAAAAAAEAATLAGVAKVLLAEGADYAHGMSEPTAALVLSLAGGFEHIVAPSGALSKSVLPRVAALMDVMVISEVLAVHDAATFDRPIYAGNAIQTVKSSDATKIMTVRTATFEAAGKGGSAPVEKVSATVDGSMSAWVEDKVASSDRPELTSAGIVVSGGRGVGSQADFALIEKLADKLNAAVGASRAAVDSGYAPNDWQVGQTGKVVAPQLYVAIGISGAIQHLAGMKDSKVIVAINKDEEAPIFQVADYGLVADLFTAVPEMIEKL